MRFLSTVNKVNIGPRVALRPHARLVSQTERWLVARRSGVVEDLQTMKILTMP